MQRKVDLLMKAKGKSTVKPINNKCEGTNKFCSVLTGGFPLLPISEVERNDAKKPKIRCLLWVDFCYSRIRFCGV